MTDSAASDPVRRRSDRYSRVAIALHWLTAAAFAFQIGLGWQLDDRSGASVFAAFQLHKSIGITILLLTLARLAWRLAHRPPVLSEVTGLERIAANAVHILFYVLLLGIPLSGWLMVSASKVPVPTMLYSTIYWPHVPEIAGLAPAAKASVNQTAGAAHGLMTWIALAAVLLHVLGALKHQLLERGDYFARMAPIAHGKALSSVAWLLVVALVAFMAIGRTLHVGRPAPAAVSAVSAPAETPVSPAPQTAQHVNTPGPIEKPADDTAAVPSKWTVRPTSSSVVFHSKWSQGSIAGKFGKWRAVITFDPDALETSSASVAIDMASATATESEQASALPSDDWFAVAAHPTAIWKSKNFKRTGPNDYLAAGMLTLRGVSKPLSIPFTLTIAENVATMTGTAKIDRTLFGVGQGEWATTADVPALVAVAITIKADRPPLTTKEVSK